ncbi:MAG TPA: ABC transporter ATP-binding protein [Clostridiales bacterium]|nr:ABC transporter ATP-binding protein [Clostridiales bacterium]HBJ98284.1 ABC transporter ATP-binding protein [Clostridiales bacterium]
METIEIHNLTKDYGFSRGIFGIDLTVKQGEMMGFVGTNGSGKTTTIRSLLGFIKPTSGNAYVNGLESWENSSEIVKSVGYVPGEIAFPDLATGTEFLRCQAEFLGLKDMTYANELIKKLQLDPRANLKRMSKGMKQKTALVCALMNNSPILIFDEPTTGLDPLMRLAFMDIIKAEHKKGKTILMSSHMFNEMEDSCDKVALIDKGKIIDVADMNALRNRPQKDFKIEFHEKSDYEKFKQSGYTIIRDQEIYNQVTVTLPFDKINQLFFDLKNFNVKFITEVKFSLEKYFKQILIEKKENENAI